MAQVIDGKVMAARLIADTAQAARLMEERTGQVPGLAVVLAGDDPASEIYVRRKIAQCRKAGIRSVE